MGQGPLVAIDVTGIIGERKTITGIQRVIFEIVPRLCRRLWARGAGVELIHIHQEETKYLWREPVSDAEVRAALDALAHSDLAPPLAAEPTLEQLDEMMRSASGTARVTLRLKKMLRANPQLRDYLNRSRRWRDLAHKVEKLVMSAPAKPAERPRWDHLVALAGGIKPVHIPDYLDPRHVLVVMHDLIPLTHPHYSFDDVRVYFREQTCHLAHRPGIRYVTPSNVIERDMRQFLRAHGQPDGNVHTVYWGYDRERFVPRPDPEWRRQLGLPDDAFTVLSVSTFTDHRKRFPDVAEAIRLCAKRAPIYGVFFGRSHQPTSLIDEHVRYLGYISDEDLPRAYSSCDLYVGWSATEGFGLPVIEALACGASVVLPPDCEAQLEVAGEHARIAAAATPEALATAILQAYVERDRRATTTNDLSRFDWERAADEMVDILADGAVAPKTVVAPAAIRRR